MVRTLGPDPQGGYQTKTEYYTPADVAAIQQYIASNREVLSTPGPHQLPNELKAALGLDAVPPRHRAHSVHATDVSAGTQSFCKSR